MSPTYKPPPPEIVKQLEESRRYAETALREGKEAYFDESDHLEGLDLAGAVLTGAMFHEANLSRCRLDDARFYDAWCGGIRFEGASLARARFVKAQLAGADFRGASGPRANFSKAEANDARFDDSDFQGACFYHATCRKCSFRKANLEEACFRLATLADANLTEALLGAVDFTKASVESANFTGASFTGATRLQGCRGLESAIADRIFFNGLPVEGDAAREVLKSLTSPNVYDLLQPRERQLRLMLDSVRAARWSDVTLKQASESLLSLCNALDEADPSWRKEVASHAATLGSARLAAPDAAWNELDEGRARIVSATLDTLDALIRLPR